MFDQVFPQLVASTSHDDTWRLWDIEKQEEILLQEGHNHPVLSRAAVVASFMVYLVGFRSRHPSLWVTDRYVGHEWCRESMGSSHWSDSPSSYI